jgi:hypothetical protein
MPARARRADRHPEKFFNRIHALLSDAPDLSFRSIEKLQRLQCEYPEAAFREGFHRHREVQRNCSLAPQWRG